MSAGSTTATTIADVDTATTIDVLGAAAMEEGIARGKLFDGSTIQFLFIDEIEEAKRAVHCGDVSLAIFVLVVQMGLYIYLARDAMTNIAGNGVAIQITHAECNDVPSTYSNMTCDAGDVTNLWPIFTGMGVMTSFILSDIASAFNAIFTMPWSSKNKGLKIAGVLMLINNLLAIVCGAYLAMLGALSSGAGAILGCVGVVFIHDMDEKTRLVYSYAPKFRQFLILSVLLVVIELAVINASLWLTEVLYPEVLRH